MFVKICEVGYLRIKVVFNCHCWCFYTKIVKQIYSTLNVSKKTQLLLSNIQRGSNRYFYMINYATKNEDQF